MIRQYSIKPYHFVLLASLIAITVLGIIYIGSAKESTQSKQILGFALGMIVMLFLSMIDYSWLLHFSPVYYGAVVLLLFYVKVSGDSSHGAQRWVSIAGIQFQPSELAKIVLILFFAWFFMMFEGRINRPGTLLLAFGLAAVPLLLILTQPDTSTTIVCIVVFAFLLFMAGLSYRIILTVAAVSLPLGIAGIIYLYANAERLINAGYYQVKRIMSWLDPSNPLYSDSASQQQYSITAIGSGHILGKGIGNLSATSMKNTNYIMEPNTDFIFAVIGEESGFLGTMIILLLIFLIVACCLFIASRARDLSGKLICCGMAALISFQSFVNLCVATGLMPNTGVTLPFVSYGLTSLVSLYIGMGFVMNVGLQSYRTKGGFS